MIFDDPNALVTAGEKKDGEGEKKKISLNKVKVGNSMKVMKMKRKNRWRKGCKKRNKEGGNKGWWEGEIKRVKRVKTTDTKITKKYENT